MVISEFCLRPIHPNTNSAYSCVSLFHPTIPRPIVTILNLWDRFHSMSVSALFRATSRIGAQASNRLMTRSFAVRALNDAEAVSKTLAEVCMHKGASMSR